MWEVGCLQEMEQKSSMDYMLLKNRGGRTLLQLYRLYITMRGIRWHPEAAILEQFETDCSESAASGRPDTLSLERAPVHPGCPQDGRPVAWMGTCS